MWLKIGITFLVCSTPLDFSQAEMDQTQALRLKMAEIVEKRFYNEYQKYLKTGKKSDVLEGYFRTLSAPEELKNFHISLIYDEPKITALCIFCRATLSTLFNLRRVLNVTRDELSDTAMDFCRNFNIQPEDVCQGLIDLNIDPILFAIDNQPAFTPSIACAMVLQGDCGDIAAPEFNFKINIDRNDEVIRSHKEPGIKGENTFKIVHITDIHYDPNYVVGNNANCGAPTCCRQKQGVPENPEDGAEYWGSYPCDTPWNAVEDAIQHVADTHPDARYIYYSGDSVDHGIWETTQEGNLAIMTKVDKLFADKLSGFQIYQSIGNHEGQPVNVFAPEYIINPNFTMNWLYEYADKSWRSFGLPPSTSVSIRRGGYYTVTPYTGFRLIVLNNNMCYTVNWWNWFSAEPLTIQLDWLHDTLLAAEKAGEKVHIILHMPTGIRDCYKVWAREYSKIVQRFYKTISAQFNGHTHRDELTIYYEENGMYAVNVAWNGGSITPYTNVNPNYRVYTIDSNNLEVLETETWYYNLTLANETPEQRPKWGVLYDFKETYKLDDLSPKSLNDFVFNLAEDRHLLQTYWEYKQKHGDGALRGGCSDSCLSSNLCQIVRFEITDTRKCKELEAVSSKKK